jgi:hypothetical protein
VTKFHVRLAHNSICTVCDKGRGTAISVLAYWRPERVPGGLGSQISRHSAREIVKVMSPMYRPALHPRKYSWFSFLPGAELTLGALRVCYIMSIESFNYTIWNRTCNQLLAHSEQSVPLCAPQFVIMLIEWNTVLCWTCFCGKTTTSYREWTMPQSMFFRILYSCCIGSNKYIVEKCIYTVYTGSIYTTGLYGH